MRRIGGFATVFPELEPGAYSVWVQGSFGPGLRVVHEGRVVGEVRGDLSIHDGWHPVGRVTLERGYRELFVIRLERSWWLAGSRRPDVSGRLAFVREGGSRRRIETVSPADASSRCGERVDWRELQ